MTGLRLASLVLVCWSILGCSEQNTATQLPQPIAMTEEAVGHYCNMNILEHTGPKAQIHLKGIQHPVWFSQVRDGIAFTRSPEEHFEALVVYVNDMGRAAQWDFPDDGTWINAEDAWFVIGSRKIGGMGAPEAVPFKHESDANAFVVDHGGTVMRLSDIPDEYVLGPVELNQTPGGPLTTGALK